MSISSQSIVYSDASDAATTHKMVSRMKLGESIATRLEEGIVSRKLPVGYRLGSEVELNAHFDVSRWTFREALSLLESSGMIEIRRGAKGGIYVAASMLEVTENRIVNYLEFIRADPDEVIALQRVIFDAILDLAGKRMDQDQRARLQDLTLGLGEYDIPPSLNRIADIWQILASACGNPALAMFKGVIEKLSAHAAWYSTLDDKAYHALFPSIITEERNCLEALLADDLAKARDSLGKMIATNRTLLEASFAGGRLPSPSRKRNPRPCCAIWCSGSATADGRKTCRSAVNAN